MTAVAERAATAPAYLRHDKPLWRRILLRTDSALVIALLAVILWATVSTKKTNEDKLTFSLQVAP